jgi:peptidoglycan/LPS O-acetylase OafA/YrhL
MLALSTIYIFIYPIPGEYLSTLGPKPLEMFVFALGTPLWVLSVTIIIYSCYRGYGGVVNDFLSWKYWLPISRLSYSIYMAGSSVQFSVNGIRMTAMDADDVIYFVSILKVL